ncbi:Tumor necrosis factor [Collichthys lucidus]|uniref:Tumor necrosis factor n=1 Tax=Collichthys lucidus TaxID=240159 RepID=A0A4U5UTS2_COLLU|nr:Tumor necrosis factor [Collichthys lucidus]
MSDGRQWLIREWESSDMEMEDLQRNTLIRFLHEKEARLQRMCHFVVVGIVLLISAALALMIMDVYGRRVDTHPGMQPTIQAIRNSTDTRHEEQRLNHLGYPMAMLTAPRFYRYEDYLEWENEIGHAFCHGGFSYANRSLVVPRKGMYRVFLQITYEGACLSNNQLNLHNMANSRLRVQSSHPALIVKTEQLVFFGAEFVPQ